MRRLTLTGISAALVLVLVAGCGGGAATPSPSTEAPAGTEAPAETEAPIATASEAVSEASPTAAPGNVMYSVCANVALREGPASDEGLVVRIAKGTKVRVVETVTGASYNAGKCGESGDQWVKISRIAGKTVKKQYDVQYVYAAAGFFGEGRP